MNKTWIPITAATTMFGAIGCGAPASPSYEWAEDPAANRPAPSACFTAPADAPALLPSTNATGTLDLPAIPVPAKLAEAAGPFGLTMNAGWQWTQLDARQTRFDWSGRPPGGAYEVRWSFWMKGKDVKLALPFLASVVESAALNLAKGSTCEPFEQPADFARLAGADRVITVCFTPAPFMTKEAHHGVLHGLLRGDTLVIVVVLVDDHTGVVPLPAHIGGRFGN